jgi:hypothetical protein
LRAKNRTDVFDVFEDSAPGDTDASHSMREVLGRVLGIYVLTRLGIICAAFYGEKVANIGGLSGLFTGWDAQHYLAIAKYGYPAHSNPAHYSRIAFFPVYPLTVRILSHLTHLSYLGVGEFVSIAAGAGLVVVATQIVARHFDIEAAERAGIILCVFPGSFVLSLPYAEALALLLAALAILTSEKFQYRRAGLFAAIATATSPLMLALVPVLAWRAWRSREPGAWMTLAMAPLGFVAYMVYLGVHTGHLNDWFLEERGGFEHRVDFLAPIQWLGKWPGIGITEVLSFMVLAWALASFVRARVPVEWWLYSVSILVVVLFDAVLFVNPRVLMNAFPLVLAIGVVASRRAFLAIALGFAILLPLVFLAYMTIGNITTQP